MYVAVIKEEGKGWHLFDFEEVHVTLGVIKFV